MANINVPNIRKELLYNILVKKHELKYTKVFEYAEYSNSQKLGEQRVAHKVVCERK